jgi:hypothetical protein
MPTDADLGRETAFAWSLMPGAWSLAVRMYH